MTSHQDEAKEKMGAAIENCNGNGNASWGDREVRERMQAPAGSRTKKCRSRAYVHHQTDA